MTAYFDDRHEALAKIRSRLAGAEEGAPAWRAAMDDLAALDRSIVWDVTICGEMPGFPAAHREAIARTVLAHSVEGHPVNSPGLDFETTEQHLAHIGELIWHLHTIFHEVALRRLEQFSDDPRSPLRCLYARGEETREGMVVAAGKAIKRPSKETDES